MNASRTRRRQARRIGRKERAKLHSGNAQRILGMQGRGSVLDSVDAEWDIARQKWDTK